MHWFFSERSPFNGISEEAADFLLMNGDWLVPEQGQMLYHAGDFVDGYYIMIEGKVHLQRKTDNEVKHLMGPPAGRLAGKGGYDPDEPNTIVLIWSVFLMMILLYRV
ncbi:hypothetical protein [Vibrio quintilis]|uniref:Cyclic nucleotide-binding domain-containing protein n=1 Tax=Vibrio quintilis TaxID=1117707 RepID=A0A1M7YYE6_9VIBR|nr:hypothetical protein [Vibrio quintilis]SHO57496.1 hypothetical protein VQ7734_03266 [Vibrio quintilis]